MNYIDGLIVGLVAIGIGLAMMRLRKSKKTNCSSTCIGCSSESTCQIKNLKSNYDNDKKTSSN